MSLMPPQAVDIGLAVLFLLGVFAAVVVAIRAGRWWWALLVSWRRPQRSQTWVQMYIRVPSVPGPDGQPGMRWGKYPDYQPPIGSLEWRITYRDDRTQEWARVR